MFVPIYGRQVEMIAVASRPTVREATVLFGGDMMFDRWIRKTTELHDDDYVLSCISPLFQKADLVVANLEGPITSNSSESVDSVMGAPQNYVFTFPTTTGAILYAHNIRVVNLGNNHIDNFGTDGEISTVEALNDAHVDYFGDPASSTVAKKVISGVPLAFINYNQFIKPGHGGTSASTTVEQIIAARKDGYVPVVYTHWGIEYATSSPLFVHVLAHEFIDAGAEIVIGSHPHVVEESEIYNGKHIYYSLGNLVFDQYFAEGVQHGLMIEVHFDPHGVRSVKEIKINTLKSGITCPDDAPPDDKMSSL